jgi:serine/threonine protein kinase
MIGQTLGHYQVLEEIGFGGMGVVHRARDMRLERDVALKVLPAGLLADAGARKRFRNEALALARLNHPNICSIFDFDTQDGVDFLVMEFVPGASLHERLGSGGLPLEEVPKVGAQLAAGLEAAHAQGVLHRDLKPGNLRITPDQRLKILDFGLAKFLHPEASTEATLSAEETSSFSGTVPYMAPEQLRNGPADPRTDIYAAGAVLYECATGQRAFESRPRAAGEGEPAGSAWTGCGDSQGDGPAAGDALPVGEGAAHRFRAAGWRAGSGHSRGGEAVRKIFSGRHGGAWPDSCRGRSHRAVHRAKRGEPGAS